MATYEYTRLECEEDGYCLNFKLSTAMEFRLKDVDDIGGSDLSLDLRELYLEWMSPRYHAGHPCEFRAMGVELG